VTIARAIELKHSSSLVSALAFETAQLYTNAGMTLSNAFDFCEPLCHRLDTCTSLSAARLGFVLLHRDPKGDSFNNFTWLDALPDANRENHLLHLIFSVIYTYLLKWQKANAKPSLAAVDNECIVSS